jgi:hypothetical protein
MQSTKIESLKGSSKNPFAVGQFVSSGFSISFNEYKNSFNDNLSLLRRKFPFEDSNKIKDILEELDNNIEMVTEILLS